MYSNDLLVAIKFPSFHAEREAKALNAYQLAALESFRDDTKSYFLLKIALYPRIAPFPSFLVQLREKDCRFSARFAVSRSPAEAVGTSDRDADPPRHRQEARSTQLQDPLSSSIPQSAPTAIRPSQSVFIIVSHLSYCCLIFEILNFELIC